MLHIEHSGCAGASTDSTQGNCLVPTPRFCHVEDVRSGHGTILEEVAIVCSRIGGSLGRSGFLGVGAERYPGFQRLRFDCCPKSGHGKGTARDSRSSWSLVAWSLILSFELPHNCTKYDTITIILTAALGRRVEATGGSQ